MGLGTRHRVSLSSRMKIRFIEEEVRILGASAGMKMLVIQR